jgi:tetratricopeptide (TPR) repeat protein
MLRTIREYASEKLAAGGEAERFQRRHAEWCAEYAERVAPELVGPDQVRWMREVAKDIANLRAALAWAECAGEAALLIRIAARLWRFWFTRGYLSEGRGYLRAALSQRGRLDRPTLALGLFGDGMLALCGGDFKESETLLKECLHLREMIGDCHGVGEVLNNLGNSYFYQGDQATAIRYFEMSLELRREIGDTRGISACLNNLASTVEKQGKLALAERYQLEAQAIVEQLGDQQGIATSLFNLGELVRIQGDLARALDLQQRAIPIWRDLGHRGGVAMAIEGVGNVMFDAGDPRTAARYFGCAHALRAAHHNAETPPQATGRVPECLPPTKKALGPIAFGRAWEEGAALSQEEAVSEALARRI